MAFKNWNWRKIRKNLIKKGRTERAVDKAIEDIRLSSDLEYCQYQIRTAAEYRALNNPKRNEIILERWNSGEIRWRYLGNSYELNVEFDRFHEAQTRDMFCLEVQEEKIYMFYDGMGNQLFTYKYGDEAVFPDELGDTGVKYMLDRSEDGVYWWIYRGKKYSMDLSESRYASICGADGQYVVTAPVYSRDYTLFSPTGILECEIRDKNRLYLHSMIIPFENEIRILKYMPIHKLFIVGSGSGFIKDLVLYDTSGEYNSTIKVPSNVFAVYSIENAVGSEIIRIGYYTENPRAIPDYSKNTLDYACENQSTLSLEWFELNIYDGRPVLSLNPYANDEYYYGYYRS